MILILFLGYGILLLWVFDFYELNYNENIQDNSNLSLCIIIDHITNVKKLIKTIDSIQHINSKQNIQLILINHSNDDINFIITSYISLFKDINIFKVDNYDFDKNIINSNNILIIKNGVELSPGFIDTITKHMYYIDIDIIFFCKYNGAINKKNIFIQLYDSFQESIKSSLINKNIYKKINFKHDCFLVSKDFFIKGIDEPENLIKANFKHTIQPNLYISGNQSDDWSDLFLLFYIPISIIYLCCLIMFISNPNLILLIAIIIKIVSELYVIYSYYNKLQIKFPKVEFLLYSVVIPFYILSEMFFIKRIFNK